MPSPTKKVIAIVGATGNQGGSVARSFLATPQWHVRCLTRNPSSQASQALSSLGAEIVQADLSSEASLLEAFTGAHAIFANTDFWEPYKASIEAAAQRTEDTNGPSPNIMAFDIEVSHGKNAARAASKIPTLERFVYSTLPPMKRLSAGKYFRSWHWESKAAIVDFIDNELPELAKKTSQIYLGGYTTNPLFQPRLDPSTGKHTIVGALGRDTRMPIIDPSASTGPFVRALIETEPAGIKLLAYDSKPSMGEVVDTWSKVTGKEVILQVTTIEAMHDKLKIPMEILEGLEFVNEFGYFGGGKEVVEPDGLRTKVTTKSFEEWMAAQDWSGIQ